MYKLHPSSPTQSSRRTRLFVTETISGNNARDSLSLFLSDLLSQSLFVTHMYTHTLPFLWPDLDSILRVTAQILVYEGDLLLQGAHDNVKISLISEDVPDAAGGSFIKQRKSTLTPDTQRRGRAFSTGSMQGNQNQVRAKKDTAKEEVCVVEETLTFSFKTVFSQYIFVLSQILDVYKNRKIEKWFLEMKQAEANGTHEIMHSSPWCQRQTLYLWYSCVSCSEQEKKLVWNLSFFFSKLQARVKGFLVFFFFFFFFLYQYSKIGCQRTRGQRTFSLKWQERSCLA